ncbi:DUF3310 domain-containing protein [Gordonibacter sp. Marseille-P4307]|uniref:DUF3310 domain-containing protein n=1 Tax=Gordonibacter sp. Marseille-P4307 TaxID=2161815 RepID=UPI000F54479C|nr:DUF3310 domain-containing protein [Gordonibacter sp. Marseille-P4307]
MEGECNGNGAGSLCETCGHGQWASGKDRGGPKTACDATGSAIDAPVGDCAGYERRDPVTAPAHYAGDGRVECKDALSSMMAGYGAVAGAQAYWAGCALKYVWRWPRKNGLQDIDKAIECLSQLRALVAEGNGGGDAR